MQPQHSFLLKIGAVVLVVWVMAGIFIGVLRTNRTTPESLLRYLQENPLEGQTTTRREEIVTAAAEQLNRLDFNQRMEFRQSGTDREFFVAMTPEERNRFIEATLPEGFRQLMLALNGMTEQERARIVKRALRDLERENPDLAGRVDEEQTKKIISQGLESFYKEANSEVKLEFAPVIERLQRASQNLR